MCYLCPAANWTLSSYPVGRLATSIDRRLEHPHTPHFPVTLRVVQTVADHELAGNVEPHIPDGHVHLDRVRLAQQGHHVDRGGGPALQVAQEPLQGQPGVDDVLDHDHMPAGDVAVEVLQDAHHTGRCGALAV